MCVTESLNATGDRVSRVVHTMAIEDSLASLHPILSPRQVHKQGVGSLQTASHVHAVVIVFVELLAWLVPAYVYCPYCSCSQQLFPRKPCHSDVLACDRDSSLFGRLSI